MEELPRIDTEDTLDKRSKKKKRKYFYGDDFKTSWQEYKKAAGEKSEEGEGKEDGFVSRWLKKFRHIFKSEVEMPEGVETTHETEKPAEPVWSEENKAAHVAEAETEPPTPDRKESREADGELVVNHDDADMEYEETPAPNDSPDIPRTEQPETESEPIDENEKGADKIPLISGVYIGNYRNTHTETHPNRDQLEKTVKQNESYQKRQERKINNRLRKLEREEKKQKEQIRHLEKDEKKLARENRENSTGRPPLAQPETKQAVMPPLTTESFTPAKPVFEEMGKLEKEPAQVEAPRYSEEPEKEMRTEMYETPANAAIDLQKRVEQAAEGNVPIEKVYEKRHEIKDEAGTLLQTPVGMGGRVSSQSSGQTQHNYSFQTPNKGGVQPLSPSNLRAQPAQTDLYSQAVRGGFLAGIVILAIVITIWLLI